MAILKPISSRRVPARLVLALTVLALCSCGGGSGSAGGANSALSSGGTTGATFQFLVTSPATVTVGVGRSAQLVATKQNVDGSMQEVTLRAAWSSSDNGKVTVNEAGEVMGIAAGTATVTAQLDGYSASTAVKVFQPNPSPTPPLSQSVAYQIDYAHSGRATVGGSGPTFPPTAHWSVTLSGSSASYPLIAGGKVFVTTDATPPGAIYGTTLYALDETTGNPVWGPTPLSGTSSFSGIAYDHGTLFVINFNGLLRTYDAATGTAGWSLQIPSVSEVTSAPTAVNGIVYVTTNSGLLAIDESNGEILSSGPGGDHSSPAVSADGIYLSGPCDAYKLDPFSALTLWHIAESCSGGGGKTVAFANNRAYVRQLFDTASNRDTNLILDAGTGNQLGTFNSWAIPAFSDNAGFFLSPGTLTAVDSTTGATLWTFSGDGTLISAPIVIDSVVVIGSSSGTVYALDAASGSVLWSGSAGAAIDEPDEQNATLLTGFGAGDGYLIVPAGNVLNGWRIIP